MLGLRALALIMCGALYTLAVDPDEVLRLFRRVSFRSALSATLATRMVPIMIRDGHRLADAQRCRPGRRPSRANADAGGVHRCARPRARRRRRAGGAWLRRRPPPAGSAAAVLTPRRRVRSAAAAGHRRLAIGARAAGSAPLRRLPVAARRRWARARSRWPRRWWRSRWRRSPTAGGCGDERGVARAEVTYTYPGCRRPGARPTSSLEIAPGELVVVAGGSGSGKSTLLRTISGLVPHFHGGTFAGTATVAGMGTRRTDPGELAAAVGTLFQDPGDARW